MDRKLLLLGLLRMQDMHGYQINDFIDAFLAVCVDVKKPTAYYLLNKMHADGWIAVEEQAGGQPASAPDIQYYAGGRERFPGFAARKFGPLRRRPI